MKIKTRQNHGGILLISLVIGMVMSISVISLLKLVSEQNTMSERSQTWNMAIATSEAGIEVALQQLNTNYKNLATAGWSWTGTNYLHSFEMPNGCGYAVAIDMSDPANPKVICSSWQSPQATTSGNIVTTVQHFNPLAPPNGYVERTIQVTCHASDLYADAIVAKTSINLNGNNVYCDSYNSANPTQCLNGQYDASRAGNDGNIACNSGIANAINVGNANIYGHVSVGAQGTMAIGPQGCVGSHNWQTGNKGVEPGYFTDDSNFTFPDNKCPFESGQNVYPGTTASVVGYTTNVQTYADMNQVTQPPSGYLMGPITTNVIFSESSMLISPTPAGTVTNTTWTKSWWYPYPGTYVGYVYRDRRRYYYNAITGYSWPTYTYNYSYYHTQALYETNHYDNYFYDGNYYLTQPLTGNTYIQGKCHIVCADGIDMSGNDTLTIGPAGQAKIYVGGTSSDIGGNGIMNENGFAGNCIIDGGDQLTSMSISGNGTITAVVNVPHADVKLNGGGHSNTDFCGALVANTITMNGHYSFHYDQALGQLPPNGRFIITSWDEVSGWYL